MAKKSEAASTHQLVGCEDALEAFQQFYESNEAVDILKSFDNICESLDIHPGRFENFFPGLKRALEDRVPYRNKQIFRSLERKASSRFYGGEAKVLKVMVVGAGPCGLRTALESQLLGARTIVVEGRDAFDRNNVVHLPKFVIEDLKKIGIQKNDYLLSLGNVHHMPINILQAALLKVRMLIV